MVGNGVKIVIRDSETLCARAWRKLLRHRDYTSLAPIMPINSKMVKRKNSLILQIDKVLLTAQGLHLELRGCLLPKPNAIDFLDIILLVHLDDITLSLLARRGKLLYLVVVNIVVELLGLARAGGLGSLWRLGSAGDAAIGAGGGGASEFLEVLAGWC